jgi:hypothetical protein
VGAGPHRKALYLYKGIRKFWSKKFTRCPTTCSIGSALISTVGSLY